MTRLTAALTVLLLLLGAGPGWAASACACGDEPKLHCCCCPSDAEPEHASAAMTPMCPRVDVGQVGTPAATTTTMPSVEPPAVAMVDATRPAVITIARTTAPATTPVGCHADPPFLRLLNLRI